MFQTGICVVTSNSFESRLDFRRKATSLLSLHQSSLKQKPLRHTLRAITVEDKRELGSKGCPWSERTMQVVITRYSPHRNTSKFWLQSGIVLFRDVVMTADGWTYSILSCVYNMRRWALASDRGWVLWVSLWTLRLFSKVRSWVHSGTVTRSQKVCFSKQCPVVFLPASHTWCLSCCSVAVERYDDQGDLWKKAFHWGLAESFRGLVHDAHGREWGGRWAGMVQEQ